ncbi:MAG: tetraacyldisaccharide 4'-kinase [Pirellulaceae bacterium]|jgi:tetraacyldisaccharide 4'-kinase|nr:tetraacyldisaccharide 4'-kinase [Pirellulaceae bacterium]MDP7020138.1 tetraacyldisaccharide 4'-kinase [Pirellulaceae bacterium]
MPSPSDYHDLMSGKQRGLGAASLRWALAAVELLVSGAVRWRNWRFERKPQLSERVDAWVVSVGNLTTGGTGKTPLVEWIARFYRQQSLRVAIISRGYGAEQGSRNDEAIELEQKLPDVPHLQNKRRVVAARTAIAELESQVLVLDDAFQHRWLARDIDIVLLDALAPFGFDHLLPRGLLREPIGGLRRADIIALTRADLVDDERRAEIRSRAQQYAPDAVWVEAAHRPSHLLRSDGETRPLNDADNWRVGAFCGIGNPAGFRRTLAAVAKDVEFEVEFADHHPFARSDIEQLAHQAAEHQVDALICTHKDLVKVNAQRIGSTPVFALAVEMDVLVGEAELAEMLCRCAVAE